MGYGSQCKIEGTEAEDGEDVTGEHDKGVAADGEDGGNGVDSKSHIGCLDDQQGHEEWGGEPAGLGGDGIAAHNYAFFYKETLAMQLVGDGEQFLEPSDDDVLRGVGLIVVVMVEHLGARIEQEEAEEAQNPFETLNHCRTSEDKDATQHQGTKDAPEEYFVLVFALDAEEREQHEEHKEVVHRQRLLNEIACQKLHCLFVRLDRIPEVDSCTEQQRHANPYGGHLKCFFHTDFMLTFLAEHLQVGNQHNEYQYVENNPSPQGHSH